MLIFGAVCCAGELLRNYSLAISVSTVTKKGRVGSSIEQTTTKEIRADLLETTRTLHRTGKQ